MLSWTDVARCPEAASAATRESSDTSTPLVGKSALANVADAAASGAAANCVSATAMLLSVTVCCCWSTSVCAVMRRTPGVALPPLGVRTTAT